MRRSLRCSRYTWNDRTKSHGFNTSRRNAVASWLYEELITITIDKHNTSSPLSEESFVRRIVSLQWVCMEWHDRECLLGILSGERSSFMALWRTHYGSAQETPHESQISLNRFMRRWISLQRVCTKQQNQAPLAFRHPGEAQQLHNSMKNLYVHIQRMPYVTDVQREIWEKIVSL